MWADLCCLCMTKYWMRDEIRLGFTLLTSARTNQDALSMLLPYCSTVCQCVEREDISSVTWALTSKEWSLIEPTWKRTPCETLTSRFQKVKFYDKKVDVISLRSNRFQWHDKVWQVSPSTILANCLVYFVLHIQNSRVKFCRIILQSVSFTNSHSCCRPHSKSP